MRRKLVLFDIDGTLLHSLGAGRRALFRAMFGDVPDHAAARAVRFDGKTDPQIVRELLEAMGDPAPEHPDRITEVLERYLTHLREELADGTRQTRVLPGVMGLLDRVEAETRAVLGLLTGNIVPGARLKLQAGAINPDRFAVGAYGSDSAVRAELPPIAAERAEPLFGRRPAGDDVIIIGDTPADVTCGRGIGARAIAVATGSYPVDELRAAGAYAVFEDLSDVDAVWEAIWA